MEYAILTDEITHAWSGMMTRRYKKLKGLEKENLRDNMTTTELVLNMLAETSVTDISKEAKPEIFAEDQAVAQRGGNVAGIARRALEVEIGKTVIFDQNVAQLNTAVAGMIEDAAAIAKQEETEEQKNKK